MKNSIQFISPNVLHQVLQSQDEYALLDVREQEEFSREHVLLACCAPLSRLELVIPHLVPCVSASVYVMDEGGFPELCRARRAMQVLTQMGYTHVTLLDGGLAAWKKAGFVTVTGVGALSKGFGEYVEARHSTPRLTPEEIKGLLDNPAIPTQVIDVRPVVEYKNMNIPGSLNLPGCEVTYRLAEVIHDPDTLIIVNCAGRTRSIIGTQTLLNAKIPNRVVALKGGTMNWQLSGFELEYGSQRPVPALTNDGKQIALQRIYDVAKRYNVSFIDAETVAEWKRESDRHTLYMFDVRQPEEYAAGHIPGSISAQGGQLVQATDEYAAVRNGRYVLIDDDELRAIMTAHWLLQMGLPNVFVLRHGLMAAQSVLAPNGLEIGSEQISILDDGLSTKNVAEYISAHPDVLLLNVGSSNVHRKGHIPASKWLVRAYLPIAFKQYQHAEHILLTADDPRLARLAALDAKTLWPDADVMFTKEPMSEWRSAGFPVEEGMPCALCAEDDVWYRPYTDIHASKEAMKGYFDWEFGLVERIKADGCVHFKDVTSA